MKKTKNKHENKPKESDIPKVENSTMNNILKNIVQIPTKLFLGNSPDRVSVKPKKKGENPLHTGPGKEMM
ncbi:MAG: hypothetical protein PHP65_00625 [Bacilli bacterium]|nr:hypothetical protein [Bacilli bacterium]